MMSDQTTTDREDSNSGSDDSSYHTNPNQPASENDEHNQVETIASKDVLRNIVEKLLSEGHKGPSIIKILLSQHNISISASTLTRKRKTWGLRQLERQQPVQVQLSPHIRASLLSSHSKGLNLQEIQARLAKETGIVVCLRTVKRYLSRLWVKLNVNDLAEGKVTLEQLYEAVHHIRNYLLHNNTGYRRMKTLLARNYNIRIPRQIVYDLLRDIDPEGMTARLRKTCKRRVFRTHGPNHVWAIDGHDKLKRFGITVYGFIDAWSRKILGLFVHITNNDPRHVGVYFLQLVSKIGGVPLKVTADYGTETCDVSMYQMSLSHQFGGITLEEATKRMHHTKSTRNQKIEALWSQMMTQHNRSIIDHIMTEIENGYYDPEDPIQKLLFLFLWIPAFQASADIWVDLNNNARKRRDNRISQPTGCSPDYSYSTPESFGTVDQLVPVDNQQVQKHLEEDYPDIGSMFTHTPPWFHSVASELMTHLSLHVDTITVGNVWEVFHRMIPYIQDHFCNFPPPSFDDIGTHVDENSSSHDSE
ncbi:hypothetical protein PCASD_09126 [Puccinia coronata f. sp. avenae]|uniref:Integrase catalytic domain-containing protein n=1 Tax=Puccinia coronata f. sp. avenae TaxID=200324 RepID=A0A2N5V4M3_9BASI|nr:hypothetical protein PCASD_09126 [Puccinia coronata f. sp. avenae]